MKYVNANTVLPDYLLNELQNYIQGEYLYIPMKKGQRRQWGALSGYRQEIADRNREILDKYANGVSIEKLADCFCLSVYAIRKILYQK